MAARQGTSTGANIKKAAKTATRKSKRAVTNLAKSVRSAFGGDKTKATRRARKPRRRSAA